MSNCADKNKNNEMDRDPASQQLNEYKESVKVLLFLYLYLRLI